jgi:glycosyltransferase involved in cell wall biosynthesis
MPIKKLLPLSVVMITYNEQHNIIKVIKNLRGWAKEIFVVDSYSTDKTVELAKKYGAKVYKKKFKNFSNQWNFAIKKIPIRTKWVMKIDPDEIVSKVLKKNIAKEISNNEFSGFFLKRYLWFMGGNMYVKQNVLRIWKHKYCSFSNVLVNEHPVVKGKLKSISGELEHHDSPTIFHWLNKQNLYSSLDALGNYKDKYLSFEPKIFGNSIERRMWLKKYFKYFPFKYFLLFIYFWLYLGSWKAGYRGYIWSKLRSFYFFTVILKQKELIINPKSHINIKDLINKWQKF